MSCMCPDCWPARRCATPRCKNEPRDGCSRCQECEDARADAAWEAAKERRLEESRP